MKKGLVLLLAVLFPTTSPLISFGGNHASPQTTPTEVPGNPMTFEDVADSDYYYDAVRWAVEHGITEGTSNTTFAPKDYCSRGQVITFLWKAMGSPEPRNSTSPFEDVSDDAYYTKAVLWAAEQKIASGSSDTTFSPNAPCSRAQVMTFLWKLKGQSQVTSVFLMSPRAITSIRRSCGRRSKRSPPVSSIPVSDQTISAIVHRSLPSYGMHWPKNNCEKYETGGSALWQILLFHYSSRGGNPSREMAALVNRLSSVTSRITLRNPGSS